MTESALNEFDQMLLAGVERSVAYAISNSTPGFTWTEPPNAIAYLSDMFYHAALCTFPASTTADYSPFWLMMRSPSAYHGNDLLPEGVVFLTWASCVEDVLRSPEEVAMELGWYAERQ